jgi:glucose/arabinose dehydrogenase
MRRGGWWWLFAALWAASASAQPEIVDPTPDDDDTDWALQLQTVDLGGATLDTPTGMVLLGSRTVQELLVLEKNTGRVRHFREGVEQPIALDLGVDTCGERGLIGIALHPFFERSRPEVAVPDPENPSKIKEDWVYLSYHTDDGAGPGDDGCDDGALFRVVRYTWDGTQAGTKLLSPVVVYEKALAASETTAVGGPIAVGLDIDPDRQFLLVGSVFIAIGDLGRAEADHGVLQNKKDAPIVFDDTSVLLRLRDDATLGSLPPKDNPFDRDTMVPNGPEQKYYAYGIHDPRSIAVDPPTQIFGTRVWTSDRGDDRAPGVAVDDEIDLLESSDNGGYSPYQGFQTTVPKNLLEDGEENPAYPLFDIAQARDRNDALVPVSTYSNPPFTFEDPELGPTGLAFGGVEVGVLHRQVLFVGTERGDVFRFVVDNGRLGVVVGPPLSDFVANIDVPEPDPKDPKNPELHDDDLTQILLATGFGRISDLETGVDGSVYVVDQEGGAIYRVFTDAVRDLAITSIKAPKKIALSDKRPTVTRSIQVTLANQGDIPERIIADTGDDPTTPDEDEGVDSLRANLEALIDLDITPVAGCAPLAAPRAVVPKYAQPPNSPAIGLAANRGRLTVEFEVVWACADASGVPDFETSASIDMSTLGVLEEPENQTDNVCPRPANPDTNPDPEVVEPDPGCGGKLPDKTAGGPIVTDVTRK